MSTPAARAIRIVAVLFAIHGIGSVASMIVGWFHDRLLLDFGILGLFIGSGLIRRSNGWRVFAVVLLQMAALFLPIVAFCLVVGARPVRWGVLGMTIGEVPRTLAMVVVAAVFALSVWMLWTLQRDDVRSLFTARTP